MEKTEKNQGQIMNAQVYRQIDRNQTNAGRNEQALCTPADTFIRRAYQ